MELLIIKFSVNSTLQHAKVGIQITTGKISTNIFTHHGIVYKYNAFFYRVCQY